eukprot:2108002-Rhodomonas_salina.1
MAGQGEHGVGGGAVPAVPALHRRRLRLRLPVRLRPPGQGPPGRQGAVQAQGARTLCAPSPRTHPPCVFGQRRCPELTGRSIWGCVLSGCGVKCMVGGRLVSGTEIGHGGRV